MAPLEPSRPDLALPRMGPGGGPALLPIPGLPFPKNKALHQSFGRARPRQIPAGAVPAVLGFTPGVPGRWESPRSQPPPRTMSKSHLALLLTVAFSLLGVVGDYFLKVSSLSEKPFRSAAFYIGLVVYSSTAFGWLFAMRHLKLATISTVYSVSIVLLLTTLGVGAMNNLLWGSQGFALALQYEQIGLFHFWQRK